MEQLTLEQASKQHADKSTPNHIILERSAREIDTIAFQAGAEWQQEQYKNIKKAMQTVISCLQNAPDRSYEIETLINACHDMPD